MFISQHSSACVSRHRETMQRWAGRVAMVTGASSGIGAAVTKELVKKGLKVVGMARRVENIEVSSQNVELCPRFVCHSVSESYSWSKTVCDRY
jgi:NADP+-dependent farnesol dehydrogenase